MTEIIDEMVWHNDGHSITIQLQKHELVILEINCPAEDDMADCQHDRHGCLVEFFLRRFGFDCNVGIAFPKETMGIAWTLVGDRHDIDACQVWVIPVDDEAFAAWLVTFDS